MRSIDKQWNPCEWATDNTKAIKVCEYIQAGFMDGRFNFLENMYFLFFVIVW